MKNLQNVMPFACIIILQGSRILNTDVTNEFQVNHEYHILRDASKTP
jgi:hypothetical protein